MPDPVTPAPAQAPAASAPPSLLKVPLADEVAAAWKQRIDASAQVAKEKRDAWKENVQAYMVRSLKSKPMEHTVTVPLEFAYVESKKSQLAFQVPEVSLKPLLPGLEPAVHVFQSALNHELGEFGAHADALIDECLTDVLLCGIACSVISYEADIRTRQVPVMQAQRGPDGMPLTDPGTGAPQMAPAVGPDGKPQTQPEQYVAYEQYRWDRVPPEQLLMPVEFEGTDFDRAPWLGVRFRMDVQTAIGLFRLPPDTAPTVTSARETLSSDQQPDRGHATIKQIEGTQIWYKTRVFDAQAQAPECAYRRLVLIDNRPEPVVHEDSPYQEMDPADGKLKGMKGNPIHPLTLRFLPGSAYPVSDVDAGRAMSEENSIFRTQQMRFRDRSMPFIGVRRDMISPDDKNKIDKGMWIPNRVQGFDGPINEAVMSVHMGTYPRENLAFESAARRDFDLSWSMSPNQVAQTEAGEPATATEVRATQSATDVRFDHERSRVLKWFTRGAQKFGSLLQQFKDELGYAEIVGPDGVKQLQAWNRKQIQGEFAYEAKPDSALRIDRRQEVARLLALYNQLGNDPNVNRVELVKQIVTAASLDASKIVVDQLPDKGPEPPKCTFSFKGEDLNPLYPQSPFVLAILAAAGYPIDAQALQNAQGIAQQMTSLAVQLQPPQPKQPGNGRPAPHGGATTPVPPLNKHAMERDTTTVAQGEPTPGTSGNVM